MLTLHILEDGVELLTPFPFLLSVNNTGCFIRLLQGLSPGLPEGQVCAPAKLCRFQSPRGLLLFLTWAEEVDTFFEHCEAGWKLLSVIVVCVEHDEKCHQRGLRGPVGGDLGVQMSSSLMGPWCMLLCRQDIL